MVIVLVGKSGCGKTAIEEHFERTISFTTRKPRGNEKEGINFYYKNYEDIKADIEKFKNKEETWIKQLSEFQGEYYGTSLEEIERVRDKELVVSVMVIDGALQMKKAMKELGVNVKIVWLEVDEDERVRRLTERAIKTGESKEKLEKRINEDYRNSERDLVDVVIENNGTMDECIEKIKELAKN